VKVKFLRTDDIETESLCLLKNYQQQFDWNFSAPIPIEEIVECQQGIDLRFENLELLIGRQKVLGAIWIEDKRIIIDESLDPSSEPKNIGRYRFTVSHELGHWVLHRSSYLAERVQERLFDKATEPSVICRAGDLQPIEWQANSFAGYALMPRSLVLDAWEQMNGNLRPYLAVDEIADYSEKWSLSQNLTPVVTISRTLATEFQVSPQAMQIRLLGLGLLKLQEDNPVLFNKW